MANLNDKEQNGVAFISGIMGQAYGDGFRASAESDGFGSAITRMAAGFAFADGWGHAGITHKEKSIAVISALITAHQPAELGNHVKIGLANGLTVAELEGILVQLTPYVGFPCIATALSAVIIAMREAGISPDGVSTPEEKGLL